MRVYKKGYAVHFNNIDASFDDWSRMMMLIDDYLMIDDLLPTISDDDTSMSVGLCPPRLMAAY